MPAYIIISLCSHLLIKKQLQYPFFLLPYTSKQRIIERKTVFESKTKNEKQTGKANINLQQHPNDCHTDKFSLDGKRQCGRQPLQTAPWIPSTGGACSWPTCKWGQCVIVPPHKEKDNLRFWGNLKTEIIIQSCTQSI